MGGTRLVRVQTPNNAVRRYLDLLVTARGDPVGSLLPTATQRKQTALPAALDQLRIEGVVKINWSALNPAHLIGLGDQLLLQQPLNEPRGQQRIDIKIEEICVAHQGYLDGSFSKLVVGVTVMKPSASSLNSAFEGHNRAAQFRKCRFQHHHAQAA